MGTHFDKFLSSGRNIEVAVVAHARTEEEFRSTTEGMIAFQERICEETPSLFKRVRVLTSQLDTMRTGEALRNLSREHGWQNFDVKATNVEPLAVAKNRAARLAKTRYVLYVSVRALHVINGDLLDSMIGAIVNGAQASAALCDEGTLGMRCAILPQALMQDCGGFSMVRSPHLKSREANRVIGVEGECLLMRAIVVGLLEKGSVVHVRCNFREEDLSLCTRETVANTQSRQDRLRQLCDEYGLSSYGVYESVYAYWA